MNIKNTQKSLFTLITGLSLLINANSVQSQIIPDNTLGNENSKFTPTEVKDLIEGGAIRGNNLFHSFSQFNVNNNQQVYFTNPTGINNILTRVTGNNISNIFGTLGVNGNANLFLINPHGIIFGQNAKLDIKGSFLASTANAIKFADNTVFSAKDTNTTPLLTMSVPVGVQWGNNQSGDITNNGNLTVENGQNLTFIGNNVTNTGNLTAPNGKIQVLGNNINILNPSTIDVSSSTGGGVILIGGDYQGKGEINAQNTNIENGVNINADGLSNGDGGKVIIWADKNTKFAGNITANGGQISGNGGFVEVSGKENLIFRGNVETTALNGLDGTLLIGTTNMIIADGSGESFINSSDTKTIYETKVEELSKVNNLIFSADNDIIIENLSDNELNMYGTMPGQPATVKFIADADKNGQGNFIMHNLNNTIKTNKNIIDLVVFCDEIGCFSFEAVILLQANNLEISGANLTLGNIDTRSVFGGGKVTLTANGNITTGNINSSSNNANGEEINLRTKTNIIGQNLDSFTGTYAGNSANAGNGGAIALTTKNGNITTQNIRSYSHSIDGNSEAGGAIALTTTGGNISTGSLYSYSYSGSGNAGNGGIIALNTTQGNISTGGNLQSFSASPGNSNNGGAINIITNGNISTQNIYSYSLSKNGNSGIGGANVFNTTDGDISTKSIYSHSYSNLEGNGGNIIISTNNGKFTATNSEINSSNYGYGIGKAGDINISAKSISLNHEQKITAINDGNGNAGNISVQATNGLFISDFSNMSSALNNPIYITNTNRKSGNIYIKAKSLFLDKFSDFNTSTYSTGSSGTITLDVEDDITLQNNSAILNYVYGTAIGNGNNININARNLSLKSGSQIMTIAVGNGNAGNININTIDSVSISGISILEDLIFDKIQKGSSSGLFSSTRQRGGKGGEITIKTGVFQLFDGGVLDARTENGSSGGSIIINANTINVTNGGQFLANTFSRGIAGNITVNAANQLIISGGDSTYDTRFSNFGNQLDPFGKKIVPNQGAFSGFFTNTSSLGNSGNINITGNIFIENGGQLSASTISEGKAGNIILNTNTLKLESGGSISAFTNGSGQGGTINIDATNSVNLGVGVQNFAPVISVETNNAGKAGDIIINTPNFILSETARITATATKNATNTEQGGSITLNANKMNLAGIVGIFAETQGAAPAGTLKLNPYKNQNTLDLTLFPGSIISASTSGSGNGGDFQISANDTINITGKGKLAVETKGTGNAGNILISTHNLNIKEAEISANTTGEGKAGSINFNADNINIEKDAKISATTSGGEGGSININNAQKLNVNSGGQLLTTTSGNNAAGDINIKVKESINLSGQNTGFFANTAPNSTGNGGNIKIDPIIMKIENGAAIAVNSDGSGIGGNIFLQAGNLVLNNGFINAQTANSNGGGIILDIGNYLLLANASKITSTAGTLQSGGNGGNIKITTPYILGFATNTNHQIIANAFTGKGGNIDITTNAIFGSQYIDIQASSQFGVNGSININTPGIDPTSGLTQLPSVTVDLSGLINNSCGTLFSLSNTNSFTFTGKGGLTPSPTDSLTPNQIFSDWGNSTNISQKSALISENTLQKEKYFQQEAQGFIKDEKGNIMLTLRPLQVTVNGVYLHPLDCQKLHSLD